MHPTAGFFGTIFNELKLYLKKQADSSALEDGKNEHKLQNIVSARQRRFSRNDVSSIGSSRSEVNSGSSRNNVGSVESSRIDASSSSVTAGLDDNIDFPEGGLQAWLAVLGSFLGLINCFGVANSISAIETYISEHQLSNVSASAVGWVFSIYGCISLLFGIFTGHVFDTQGPRIPIILGTVLTFSGIFATANCTKIYQFILTFGVINGLGAAVQMSSLLGILSHYFYKKRGMAVGLATVGGSVGGAVFPVMLRKLYSTVGFQWAMRIFAIILGCLDLAAVFLIQPRFPPKKQAKGNVAGDIQMLIWQKAHKFIKNTVDFEAFKDPQFIFCALAVSCSEVFFLTSTTYYGSYAIFKGNSENTAYLLITIMNVAGIFARALAGYGSDKVGKFNLMIIMLSFSVVFCLTIWLPIGGHSGALYAFSCLFGISTAAILSLSPLCISQISRVEDFGKKYATCYLVVSLFTLVGLPISALFIGSGKSERSYDNFIIFTSMLGFLGVAFWVIARYYAVRLKLCIY